MIRDPLPESNRICRLGRRALLQLASQLPDQTENARIILRLTTELLENILDEPKPTEKPSPVVIVGDRNLIVSLSGGL